jgi:hypothetical protein
LNEQGPFDRMLDPGSGASRDKTARGVLIAMGVVGLVLLVLVISPLSIFGGDDIPPGDQQPSAGGNGANSRAPRAPDGFEALSRIFELSKPKGTNGPYALTVNLLEPVSDGRNLALYTNSGGKWERISNASLVNNGSAASGQVNDMPKNVAVLRRTTNAAAISGSLALGPSRTRRRWPCSRL